jgi:hypothetical protein
MFEPQKEFCVHMPPACGFSGVETSTTGTGSSLAMTDREGRHEHDDGADILFAQVRAEGGGFGRRRGQAVAVHDLIGECLETGQRGLAQVVDFGRSPTGLGQGDESDFECFHDVCVFLMVD